MTEIKVGCKKTRGETAGDQSGIQEKRRPISLASDPVFAFILQLFRHFPHRDQVGSVTFPRPPMTGKDFPVGTSSREIVLPVL